MKIKKGAAAQNFQKHVSSNIGRSGATSNSAPALQAHPGRLSPLAATAAAAGAGSQRPRRRQPPLAAGHGGWPRARRAPSEWHPQWRRPTKLEALRRTWSLIPTARRPNHWANGEMVGCCFWTLLNKQGYKLQNGHCAMAQVHFSSPNIPRPVCKYRFSGSTGKIQIHPQAKSFPKLKV